MDNHQKDPKSFSESASKGLLCDFASYDIFRICWLYYVILCYIIILCNSCNYYNRFSYTMQAMQCKDTGLVPGEAGNRSAEWLERRCRARARRGHCSAGWGERGHSRYDFRCDFCGNAVEMNSWAAKQLWFPCESGAPHIPIPLRTVQVKTLPDSQMWKWRIRCSTTQRVSIRSMSMKKANLHFTFGRFIFVPLSRRPVDAEVERRQSSCLNLQRMRDIYIRLYSSTFLANVFGSPHCWLARPFFPLLSTTFHDVCEVLPSKGSATHGSGKLDSQTWWFHRYFTDVLIEWLNDDRPRCRPCAWYWKPQAQHSRSASMLSMCSDTQWHSVSWCFLMFLVLALAALCCRAARTTRTSGLFIYYRYFDCFFSIRQHLANLCRECIFLCKWVKTLIDVSIL